MSDLPIVAAVELGGTKSIAVLAQGSQILHLFNIPTTSPSDTLGALAEQLHAWCNARAVAALGVATFGPVCLHEQSPDYGRVLDTPKPSWSGADLLTAFAGLGLATALDTDVNAAALAEWKWGSGQGLTSLCYLTIGTGVGGGLVIAGEPLHGALHPEVGHLRLRRAPDDDFSGVCPFHGDCIEGLISGPALKARFGCEGTDVHRNDPRWQFVASDLAELVGSILLTYSAERVLIGGGIGLGQQQLLDAVRKHVTGQLNSYLPHVGMQSIGETVRLAGLGHNAGPLGAVALAYRALDRWEPRDRYAN